MTSEEANSSLAPNRAVLFYLAVYTGLCVLAFWSIFFISEYWQIDSVGKLLSFYPSDGPGSVASECLPDPIGLHYFGDFVSVVCHSHLGSPYLDTSTNYFPAAYLLMKIFYPLMHASLWIGLGVFYSIGGIAVVYITNALLRHTMTRLEIALVIFVAIGTAQPVIALLDRGNLQVLVTLLVFFAAVEMSKDSRTGKLGPWVLGLATALKGYPLIFAFAYLQKREYKKFALTLVVAATSTLVALLTFSGGIVANFKAMKDALLGFRGGETNWLRYNVSLKAFLYSVQQENVLGLGRVTSWLINNYLQVIIILAFVAMIALIRLPFRLPEQFLIGAIFCGLLVDFTSSYVLTIFLVPLLLLLKSESLTKLNIAYLSAIALLMVPKGISISNGPENHANRISTTFSDHMPSLASFVNPLLMLILGVIAVSAAISRLRTSKILVSIRAS